MKRYLIMTATVVAIVSLFLAGCATTSKGLTPEEQIMNQMEDAIAAITAKDYDVFEKYVSQSFSASVIGDKDDLLAYLEAAEEMGFLQDLKVDTSEVVITVEGDQARMSGVVAEGVFGYQGLSFEGVRENGVWVITGLSPF